MSMKLTMCEFVHGMTCEEVCELLGKIVRCRDCVYNAKDADGICYRFDHEHFNQPNGFCSWGERREQ